MIRYKSLLIKPFLKFCLRGVFLRQSLIWQEFPVCAEITLNRDLADDISFLLWKGAETCQNDLWDMSFESAPSQLSV